MKTVTNKCFLSVRQGAEHMTHVPHIHLTTALSGPTALVPTLPVRTGGKERLRNLTRELVSG